MNLVDESRPSNGSSTSGTVLFQFKNALKPFIFFAAVPYGMAGALAPLVVVFKSPALWKRDERYNKAARFRAKIFAANFLFGGITGIPIEFQFGTNWARFSQFSGSVVATAPAMEGIFAFSLESSFLGLFLYGEKRFGQKVHRLAAFMVFAGSWLSGYFIIVTDAWMQRPVGFELAVDGTAHLVSFPALLFNEWAFRQYLHNMGGALVTGSFVMAAVGAFYLLSRRQEEYGRLSLKLGVTVATVASLFQLFPTGDRHGKLITELQRLLPAPDDCAVALDAARDGRRT